MIIFSDKQNQSEKKQGKAKHVEGSGAEHWIEGAARSIADFFPQLEMYVEKS